MALPSCTSKVLKDLQHAIEQVFPTGSFTLETVEETLLFLLKKGALKTVKTSTTKKVKAVTKVIRAVLLNSNPKACTFLISERNNAE